MADLFDLPAEKRREILTRMGRTEEEYRAKLARDRKALDEAPQHGYADPGQVSGKFKEPIKVITEGWENAADGEQRNDLEASRSR